MSEDNKSKIEENLNNKKDKPIQEEKHLTSDIHMRYRGHPSEMIPRHGALQTNMPPGDIHEKN